MDLTSRLAGSARDHRALLVAWAISDAILLTTGGTPALFAGAVLYAYLPGVLLLDASLGRTHSRPAFERAALSAAAGYLVSTLTVLVLHFLPGPLTLAHVLVGLNVILAALFALGVLLRRPVSQSITTDGAPHSDRVEMAVLVALVVVTLAFRFVSLGYSEYQGDEIDVTRLAALSIAGDDDALFLHRKGPVEIVVAASFALFHRDFNELALRFPFALASAWSVLATYALGRRLIGRWPAAIGAALLAANGIFLGFSRMVQYQGLVALMLVTAVLCFRLSSDEEGRGPVVLGLALWGLGLLSHYEAVLIGLPLLVLFVDAHRRRPSTARLRAAVLTGGVIVAALLAYYLPFVAHPHFSDTFRRYTEIRISLDRAPFNNLGDYLASAVFYNSVYYEAVLFAGLLIAALVALRTALRPTRAGVLWALFVLGLAGSALVPAWLDVGGLRLGLLLVLPGAGALVLAPRIPACQRALFAWFGVYLLAYAFLIRTPGLHYYTLAPAWALLAAWGWSRAATRIARTPARWPAAALGATAAVLIMYHPVLLFLRAPDEYALRYPAGRSVLYPNAMEGSPDRFFGLPHRSGWKALGVLFADGPLRGATYRSNEKTEITSWYVGAPPSDQERPDYYLIALNPTEKPHRQDYPREMLQAEYRLAGQVTREGLPCIEVYCLGKDAGLGSVEDRTFAPVFDRMVGLGGRVEATP